MTKFGDEGKTALLGGEITSKCNIRVEAYGTVDELNSFIGLAATYDENNLFTEELTRIQNDLHLISSHLALSERAGEEFKNAIPEFENKKIFDIEKLIEKLESEIPPLDKFILYGGDRFAAILQVLRCIARRAERRVVELSEKEKVEKNFIIYLNRLSDLFFVMSRKVNLYFKIPERAWKKE